MSTFRRIPMEEILHPSDFGLLINEVQRAREAGSFEFGVDKTDELGFRLTINGQQVGIYLYPDANEFRRRIGSPSEAVIAADPTRAGSIEHANGDNIAIYVSPEKHEQFCLDAQTIYDLYTSGNLCFRSIPDVWFSDLALIQFIRDHLQPHPVMGRMWFHLSHAGFWGAWVGPKLTK